MSRSSYTSTWALTLLVGALILCTVALVNGGPIVYPDSGVHLGDGDKVLHLKAPFATRPVFYGVAIWFLHLNLNIWPVLIAQGLIVAHVVWLTLRVSGAILRPMPFLGLLIGLAVFTPLSWHVSHVLPDIFTPVLILAMFLLGFGRDRLGRAETVYLFLLSSVAICFHLTNLVVALGLALLILVLRFASPHFRGLARPLLAGAPVLVALLVSLAFSAIVFNRVTLTPNSPPHLMARLIMDGPGRNYLNTVCPTSDLAICKHLDTIPESYEGFLWVYMNEVGEEDGRLIRLQQGRVLQGTIKMFPLEIVGHMLANTAEQLVTIESKTDFPPPFWEALRAEDNVLSRATTHSLQSRGLLDGDALDDVNLLHAAVALLSFVACLWLIRACWASRLYWACGLITWIFMGLLANAFAGGALSGPFGRYQGRVIWLLPLAAAAAGVALVRNRPPVVSPARRRRERLI